MTQPTYLQVQVSDETDRISQELAQIFNDNGKRLFLVGGSVRDALLGRKSNDLDFTTNALPHESEQILRAWGEQFWDPGAEYGTVCAVKDGQEVQITTFRKDTYDPDSRKPEVEFGDNIWDDLTRRDFRVNAMAIEILPDGRKVLYALPGAQDDLENGLLTTPLDPATTFAEDPLRMIRAARFVSQLGFNVDVNTLAGIIEAAPQLAKVADERIIAELDKMLLGNSPYAGAKLLEVTGVTKHIVPEAVPWPSMSKLPPGLDVMWAAWLLQAGPIKAHDRLVELKHNHHIFQTAPRLIALVEQFMARGDEWDPAQVRKFVWDAGELFDKTMNILVELDMGAAVNFWFVFAPLEAAGDTDDLKQPLTGEDIMDALNIPPSQRVGQAIKMLQNFRLENGPAPMSAFYHQLNLWWDGKA